MPRTSSDSSAPDAPHFRAGICSIVGLPNVGKSTVLNQLVGERLSIVSSKAQTTRQRLLGIYTDSGHQAVFVDTPGLLDPRYALHEAMQAEAERALSDADVLLYVLDAGWSEAIEHATRYAPPGDMASILCINKRDRVTDRDLAGIRRVTSRSAWDHIVETVATAGTGIDELRDRILSALPVSPPLYPVDEIAAAPVRFFAAEYIRETCFELLSQELPYSIAVGVEEYRESSDPIYIGAVIHVERASQKGIVIGRGGRMIRAIGEQARRKIEELVERSVYLDLRVKVLTNWRRRPGALKLLGYVVPPRSR